MEIINYWHYKECDTHATVYLDDDIIAYLVKYSDGFTVLNIQNPLKQYLIGDLFTCILVSIIAFVGSKLTHTEINKQKNFLSRIMNLVRKKGVSALYHISKTDILYNKNAIVTASKSQYHDLYLFTL